jgi:predicted helicase
MSTEAFEKYLAEINKAYQRGDSTEHTHRPALKTLVETLGKKITATNEPKRVKCGAPDFSVSVRKKTIDQTIGYMECKDIGKDLAKEAKNEQIKERYLKSFDNFVLTDYIKFQLFINGEKSLTAELAEESGGKFKTTPEKIEKVSLLIRLFLDHEPQRITTAKVLATKMAGIAKLLRELIHNTFDAEQETGALHSQFAAFKEVLLHDLTEEQFADMYAQTICYGLFSARCHIDDIVLYGNDPQAVFHGIDNKSKEFTRDSAAYLLPKTNPFLRKTFNHIAGPELDGRIAWLVDDLVELLRHCDMGTILRDFARQTGRKDPVVHFYETFLSEYDKKLKKARGVYYTPDEVVSYIVRSVDILLKEKFGLKRGLADDSKINGTDQHKLLILDPAVGTGTFLFEVINQVHDKFKRQKGAWSSYVKEHLLPRIFGFELMMAPYTICHMKLGLELAETGYEFDSDDRLGVYLTNTLEEAEEKAKSLFAQWIAEEAREANKIKKDLPIMVVLGNPPYSIHSANASETIRFIPPGAEYEIRSSKGKLITKKAGPNGANIKQKTFIGNLLEDYKKGLNEKKLNLDDDFIKFIRFGQHRIEQTGSGVLAFITNNTYIDGITHRRMRESLLETFDEIFIVNLHGHSKKKETCPDDTKDENVFDIQQGVAVTILVKLPVSSNKKSILYFDSYGLRKLKNAWLLEHQVKNTNWKIVKPKAKNFFLAPKNFTNTSKYEEGIKITDIFPVSGSGIKTDRDGLFFDIDKDQLKNKIETFYSSNGLKDTFREQFNVYDSSSYDLISKRNNSRYSSDNIHKCLYRPYDIEWLYYSKEITSRSAWDVMQHLTQNQNIALLSMRQYEYNVPDYCYTFVSNTLTECRIFISNRGMATVSPLYLYGQANNLFDQIWPIKNGRVPNLDKKFVDEFADKIKLEFVSDGTGDLTKTFGPEDVFHYIYAVLHSPEYRKHYAEFLKIDFPRIPLPKDKTIFKKLCKVGAELTAVHLMESEILEDDKRWPEYAIEGENVVEKGYPKYVANADKPEKGKVYINKSQYFEGVRPDVWEFHLGGYQVCQKWLKDRRERTLSYDDINHYRKIAVALGETIRLMKSPCLFEMFEQ